MKHLLPLAAYLLAATAPQGDEAPEFQRPDPTTCSVCAADPARMEKAGIVSHGEFRFGETDTEIVSRLFTGIPIRWIEGPHVKLGFADVEYDFWFGGDGSDPEDDPSQPGKRGKGGIRQLGTGALTLEPWHKTHVYLERAEALYTRVAGLLDVEPDDLPTLNEYDEPVAAKNHRGKYMGEGPHLGQAAKFEILILPGAEEWAVYLKDARGLDEAKSLLHLVPSTDAVGVTIHQMDGDMWDDDGLHGHLAHLFTHALIDSYRHYSYAGPLWISSGLAHMLEREVNNERNTFCGGHPTTAEARELHDWTAEAKQLASKRKATALADLLTRDSHNDFTLADHVTSWSMVTYLVAEHPGAFAGINADVRGLSKGKQPVDAMILARAHSDAFARHLGWTYAEFDKAWAKWAKKQKKRR
ncbi:MAG: hypothetical protein P1V81_09360 [Planctomycetota bacterium]|nr:hypothetical protein [Planctomycetota bacterium]